MSRFLMLISAFSLVGILGCSQQPEIQTTVINKDSEPMSQVALVVSGGRHELGTIPPGGSASVRLQPRAASTLVIELGDTGHTMDVDAYFEPGYRGTIQVSLDRYQVSGVEKELYIGQRRMP